jgi:hypothetical protein
MYTSISVHTHAHIFIQCIATSVGIYIHTYISKYTTTLTDIRRSAARRFRAHGFVGVSASGAARADERLRPTCT